jgi:ATP-dependent RNA helicase DeaD
MEGHKESHPGEHAAHHDEHKTHDAHHKHDTPTHDEHHDEHDACITDIEAHRTDELPQVTFRDIIDDAELLAAVDRLGFTHPTEIQALTIPPGMQGRDLIGQAKTGSGKTFAFGIPIMHTLTRHAKVQALVLAPTRELVVQITAELQKLTTTKDARVISVYGGVSINPQIDELQEADIVVGTPGRILDHLERDTFDTSHVRTLVLDEADRMLDMGFIEDVERIIQALPAKEQTMLFSATMPEQIKELSQRYLHDPEHIKVQSFVEEHLLPQFYYVVPRDRKFSLLCHLLSTERPKLGIIFTATRTIADTVARNLRRHNIDAQEIHGGLSQSKREKIIADFKTGKLRVLVATDVAARGLDIKNVSHVFNYDVPKNPDDYIHRIGRTARAGESGKAITLLEDRDFEFFQAVLELPNVSPTELNAGDFRSYGFRKHEDGEGSFGGSRGPRRDGGRSDSRGGDRRDGPRSGSYGGSRPQRGERRQGEAVQYSEPREHAAPSGESGDWRQSKRKR